MQLVGQRIPIIVDKDCNIIDVHHQFKICRELGIEPEFETQDLSEEQKQHKPDIWPSQPSQSLQQSKKQTIYRIGHTDNYGCQDCRLTDDKFFMKEHSCRRNK